MKSLLFPIKIGSLEAIISGRLTRKFSAKGQPHETDFDIHFLFVLYIKLHHLNPYTGVALQKKRKKLGHQTVQVYV